MEIALKFTSKDVIITGASQFKGEIDGEQIDANSIFVMTKMNARQGGLGDRTVDKRAANAGIVDGLKGLSFPVVAEVDFEEEATKGKVAMIVTAIRPNAKSQQRVA